jgi:hypothetical protein
VVFSYVFRPQTTVSERFKCFNDYINETTSGILVYRIELLRSFSVNHEMLVRCLSNKSSVILAELKRFIVEPMLSWCGRSSGQVVRQPSVESTASWGGAGPATMPSIPEQGPPTGYSSEEEDEDSEAGPPGTLWTKLAILIVKPVFL